MGTLKNLIMKGMMIHPFVCAQIIKDEREEERQKDIRLKALEDRKKNPIIFVDDIELETKEYHHETIKRLANERGLIVINHPRSVGRTESNLKDVSDLTSLNCQEAIEAIKNLSTSLNEVTEPERQHPNPQTRKYKKR